MNGAIEKTEDYKYDDSVAGYDVMKGELASVTETGPNGQLTSRFSYDPIYRRIAKMSRVMPGVGEFSQTFVHNMLGQVTGTQYQNSAFLKHWGQAFLISLFFFSLSCVHLLAMPACRSNQ